MKTIAVFGIFLRLGLTSFGGPLAHIGYFHEAFVRRRRWLDAGEFADLVALCHFLPGPASSQVGLAIGRLRAGVPGAFAAWLGFTLPSAVLMTLFALGIAQGWSDGAAWLHALKLVAVAVVAQAVWMMGRALWTDRRRVLVGSVAAAVLLAFPVPILQLVVIGSAALAGRLFLAAEPARASGAPAVVFPAAARWLGAALLVVFAGSLLLLPLAARFAAWPGLEVLDAFFRAGSLVFGGGHVLLPLLQGEVVAPGWVDPGIFLAGYGAAQALPGPLFTFAAFLGVHVEALPGGVPGAVLALLAVFAPSFLLVLGVLPFWSRLRTRPGIRAALAGIGAAVVGLLLAALYDPVIAGSVRGGADVAWVLAAFVLLHHFRWPPWLIVGLSAGAAEALRGAGMLAGSL